MNPLNPTQILRVLENGYFMTHQEQAEAAQYIRQLQQENLTLLGKTEPTPRQLQRLRQEAWKNIKQDEYKFDPEVCFAMGFDAGYGAVARKVEPSQDECGGFDSRPAPLKENNGAL